jgi:PTS system N-acetylglucosamine-specific IIC component
LREVEACTTRLRIVLRDRARVDAQALRRMGARGTVDIGADGLQVVVGPVADSLASSIRARLASPAPSIDVSALAAALGGRDNIAKVQSVAGRVLVDVKDTASVDLARLEELATRGAAIANASVHLLHPDPSTLAAALTGA